MDSLQWSDLVDGTRAVEMLSYNGRPWSVLSFDSADVRRAMVSAWDCNERRTYVACRSLLVSRGESVPYGC